MNRQPVYLDCAASTPMEPEVIEFITYHFKNTWGNPHSRTHEYGSNARRLIEIARQQVATVVDTKPQEILFTSGATEANNIVIQSLVSRLVNGENVHVLASCIEHPSVLEPLKFIQQKGAVVELIDVGKTGQIDLEDFHKRLRPTTDLVSIMQVNSETGIKQPIAAVCEALGNYKTMFHVDAAQGFGKDLEPLRHPRIDFISCSSHKIFGPKGVGALIAKDNKRATKFLQALVFGGEQERKMRSGTVPNQLIGGFGLACKLALDENANRKKACEEFGTEFYAALDSVDHRTIGSDKFRLPSTAYVAFPGIDSESFIILTKKIISVSNGTACASGKHMESSVLRAMKFSPSLINSAIRFSWSHLTPTPSWNLVIQAIEKLT